MLLAIALLLWIPGVTAAMPVGLVQQTPLWEAFLESLTDVLQYERYHTGHFICREECVSEVFMKRLNLKMSLTYTLSLVRQVVPAKTVDKAGNPTVKPLPLRTVFIVVGLEKEVCEVVRSMTSNIYNIVVIMSFRPLQDFLGEMGAGFDGCWKHELLKVVAIHSSSKEGSLGVYKFDPYYPDNCRDMRPRLIRRWTPAWNFSLESIGLKGKLRNFNGCIVRVVTFPARPWINPVANNLPSRYTIEGAYNPLINEVERRLNFSARIAIATDNSSGSPDHYPNFGGMLGDLYQNRSDLALMLSPNEMWLRPHFDRPPISQMACTTWCLPVGKNPIPIWRPLVDEFEAPVWAGLLLAYVVAAIVFRLLSPGSRIVNTAFTAMRALVGPVHPEPRAIPARAYLFCWSFFGLVMSTLYMGALHSISTTDTTTTVFRSLRELADSALPLHMSDTHYDHFSGSQVDDELEARILRRAHVFPLARLIGTYHRLFFKRDIGLLIDRNGCRFYASLFAARDHYGRRKPAFHTLRGYCMANNGCSSFILKTGSHLMQPLKAVLSGLDGGGLFNYWMTPPDTRDEGVHDPVMRFQQLKPFLRLLGVGLAASAVTFLAELLYARFKRGRQQGIAKAHSPARYARYAVQPPSTAPDYSHLMTVRMQACRPATAPRKCLMNVSGVHDVRRRRAK